jgi:hypothetical protein
MKGRCCVEWQQAGQRGRLRVFIMTHKADQRAVVVIKPENVNFSENCPATLLPPSDVRRGVAFTLCTCETMCVHGNASKGA